MAEQQLNKIQDSLAFTDDAKLEGVSCGLAPERSVDVLLAHT